MIKIVETQVSQHKTLFGGIYYIKNIIYEKPDKTLGMIWFKVDFNEYKKYRDTKK